MLQKDLEHVVLAVRQGRPILLRDVAPVKEVSELVNLARLNGKSVVALAVMPTKAEEQAKLVEEIHKALPRLKQLLPETAQLTLLTPRAR